MTESETTLLVMQAAGFTLEQIQPVTGRCGTCRHWERNEDRVIRKIYGDNVGSCSCDKFVSNDKAPAGGVTFHDHEGYGAGFHTHENFGCIHWMQSVILIGSEQ